jgi:hypothetical protein
MIFSVKIAVYSANYPKQIPSVGIIRSLLMLKQVVCMLVILFLKSGNVYDGNLANANIRDRGYGPRPVST